MPFRSARPITKILLVDDQSIILDGLAALLQGDPEMEVVGTASSGEEAIEQVARLRPDVIVMDISMPPGMDGIEATRQIMKRFRSSRILILSMYHQASFIKEVLAFGGMGYVLKNTSRDEFREAIRTVARGERYLSEGVQHTLNTAPTKAYGTSEDSTVLTRREKEILVMVARQMSNQMIADILQLSLATVETHRRNIRHKLNLHNTAGMVKYAIERGWLA